MREKERMLIRNLLLLAIMAVFILVPSKITAKAEDGITFDYGSHYLGKNSYAYRMLKWCSSNGDGKYITHTDLNENGEPVNWPDIEEGAVVNNMVFDGWYADASFVDDPQSYYGGRRYYRDDYYSEDITLYARWKFTVTYDAGEGNYINDDYYNSTSAYDSEVVDGNKLVRTSEGSYYIDTTRVAHYKDDSKAFVGWKYKGIILENDTLAVGVNTTLEAVYEDAYKITFDSYLSTATITYYLETYNKEGDYNNNKVNLGKDKFTITYPKGVDPKDADYMSSWPFYSNSSPVNNTDSAMIFKEWNTKADGSGETIYDFDHYYPNKDGNDTLYAIWSGYHTITLKGGEKDITPITFKVITGDTVGSNAYHYVSSSYYRTSKFKNSDGVYLSSSYKPTKDETFFACDWYEVYTVHVSLDGGAVLTSYGDYDTYTTPWDARGDSEIGDISQGKIVKKDENGQVVKIAKGWSLDENENRSVSYDSKAKLRDLAPSGSHDIWLYPIWESTIATATFVVDAETGDPWGTTVWYGGKNVPKYTVPYIKGTVIGEAPVIPGYVNNDDETGKQFRGWRREDSTALVDLSTLEIDSDEVFYADFDDTVTISYRSNDEVYNQEYVVKGTKFEVASYGPFNSDGMAFLGWTDKKDSTVIRNGMTYTADAPKSFYAVWEEGLQITLIGNGGQVHVEGQGSSSKGVMTIQKGKPVLSCNDEWGPGSIQAYREDYVLKGWSLTNGGDILDLTQFVPSGDTTFYANWEESVEVVFVDGEGKELSYKEVAKNSTLDSFPEVSLSAGQAVEGWFTDADYETAMTLTQPITQDMVIYAKITSDVWTVTFDSGSGDEVSKVSSGHYSSGYGDKTLTVSVPKNRTIDVSAYQATISDSDDVFMGWKAEGLLDWTCGTSGSTFTPQADVTITAKFGKGYTVTFDGNQRGVIPVSDSTTEKFSFSITPGQSINRNVTAIPKDGTGYIAFTGWYLANGTKVGDANTISSYKPSGDVTLLAGWKDATVTVTGVVLNKTSISLGTGESYQLEASVVPSNASNKGVAYTSSDKTLATVDEKGLIKVADKATGVQYPKEVTITVTTADQGKTETCIVTITSITNEEVENNITTLTNDLKTKRDYLDDPDEAKKDVDKILHGLGGVDQLAGKVETNDSVKEKISELDAAYKDIANIEMNMPMANDLKEALGNDISVNGNMEVTGAALNAKPDSKVELTVKATAEAEKKNVDETKFTDAVQFDLGLTVTDKDGKITELANDLVSPVTLKLPLPASRIKSKLYILHFNEETGEYEIIRPKFIGNAMEFTVSHFSTFVLVHLADTTAIDNGGDNGGQQNPDADPQGGSPTPAPTPDPTPTPTPTPTPAADTSAPVGTTTDTANGSYVVSGNFEVTYNGAKDKKAKKAKIDSTVTIEGKEYKVTAIKSGAFKNCKKLTSVTIPSSVTTIGANAFAGCKELKKVTIPAGVTSIGKNAFKGCGKLSKITIKSTSITSIGKNAFKGIKKGATIKVPKSKKKDYQKLLKKAKVSSDIKIK